MTTAYTSYLGLALPVTGELSGTWGDTVNNYITQYLDASVAGTNTLSSDSDVTLVKTTNASLTGTSSQYAVLLWTAGGTATRTIIAPSASSGSRQFYIVVNKTSSTQSIKLCGAGPTTGVTVTAGTSALCAWNGVDFIQIGAGLINLVTGVTGTLPVANGGTGLTAGTSGGVPYYSSTSAITSSALLTSNALVIGGGAGAAPSTVTTGTGVVTALGVNTGTAGAFVVNGGALGTPASGTLTNVTVDGTNSVGYLLVPQNAQSAGYTLVLSDSGKHIYMNSAGAFTIPANSSVAFSIGTAVTFVNMQSTSSTIAITSDTMYLAGVGTTGTRTLAQYGVATALKIAATTWIISGSGLT
jgi:hypothetical protein